MNKQQLVAAMANSADLTKADAGKLLQGFIETISRSLSEGERIALTGFGTFAVVDRKPRTCRNPHTGELLNIPARKAVKFKPGKELAEKVNR